jgi:type I restriction enzyme S subunit
VSLPDEFKRFPRHWDVLPFTDVVSDATSGNIKIQKGEYLDEGEIPVVDQGQALFGGYTDNSDAVCKAELPTIIFGDHTRLFKFIEQPFALGADGVKVLEPVKKLDKKFLFHYLNQLRIPSAGYSRHYKFLKETYVPIPPLLEQIRIAAILDKAYAIRRKRQQAIQLADEFLRSVFLDMFGDPATNPKGWDMKTVSECLHEKIILQVQDGNHGNDHPKVNDFIEEGIPFVTANVVRRGKILFDQCYYLGEEWLEKLRIGFAKPRDVLVSHKGSLGFTAVLDDSFDNYILSPQTTYYRVDENHIMPEYLKTYFDSAYFQRLFEKEGIQSTRAYLGITRQKELPIMLPSIHIQREFVDVCDQFKKVIDKLVRSGNELPNCFNALSQKAFAGEL